MSAVFSEKGLSVVPETAPLRRLALPSQVGMLLSQGWRDTGITETIIGLGQTVHILVRDELEPTQESV